MLSLTYLSVFVVRQKQSQNANWLTKANLETESLMMAACHFLSFVKLRNENKYNRSVLCKLLFFFFCFIVESGQLDGHGCR